MSDYLFARPTIIDGVASIIDLFGIYSEYNTSSTPEEADKKALVADLLALKNDADIAMGAVLNATK